MSQLLDNDITTDSRPYVMELQSYLRAIQRARYGTTTVPMDGFYGADTADGVRQFQQAEKLPITGAVNRETWEAIYAVYLDTERRQTPPTLIRGLRRPLLQPGDRGDAVIFLNVMLGIVGNEYTVETEEIIRTIQRISFLPVTGNTDKDTWDAVVALYNRGDPRE